MNQRITKTIFLTAAEAAVYKSTGTCQHVTPDGDTITVSDTDTDCIVYCPEDEPATKAELAEAVKHHYSTTEQVVGTWIDGKPIYEILLPCSVTGNMKNSGGAGIEDISAWVGDYSSLNAGRVIDLKIITENGCLYKPCCMNDNGVIKFRQENYVWNGNETATHFLIQYTKTTD